MRPCLGSSRTGALPPAPPLRDEHLTFVQRRAAGVPAGIGGAHSKRETWLGCPGCLTAGKDCSLLICLGNTCVKGGNFWHYGTRFYSKEQMDIN